MSLDAELLELAERLIGTSAPPRSSADVRRAVSTAYYALFHLLVREAVDLLSADVSEELRRQVRRTLEHTRMAAVCRAFCGKGTPPKLLSDLLKPTPAPAGLRTVAASFVDLQDKRHAADYDTGPPMTALEAEGSVRQAREAFEAWGAVRSDPSAVTFLAALMFDLKGSRG